MRLPILAALVFLKDGNTLYVFSANRTSVSLWKLIDPR